MNILIAIPSCRAHLAYQQAQRDTWIRDIPLAVDIRFFIGEQSEICEDEVYLGEDVFVPSQGLKEYPTLPNKTKLVCEWALKLGYDYVFKTDTDTLVNVKNLLNSGFENNDYSGGYNHEEAGDFASGGAGYWLSRKAMRVVTDSFLTYWAEDVFVALALREKGILAARDVAFADHQGDAAFTLKTHRLHGHHHVLAGRDFLQFARMQPVPQLAPHLVFEPKLVHQPGLARLGRGERPLVDDVPHRLGRFLPSLRDSRHQVSVQIIDYAGHYLTGFRTHVRPGEHVAVVFILAGVLHIDADAELVQDR